MNDFENLENLENNEKIVKSNYKKLLWVIAILNIVFLLGIFALNFACYNALESKCPDNIQLSNNTKPLKDKKSMNDTYYNNFIEGLQRNGYPYYAYTFNSPNSGGTDYDDVYSYFEDELALQSVINIPNGNYNIYYYFWCDYAYNGIGSTINNVYVNTIEYYYDDYSNNSNNYFIETFYLNRTFDFINGVYHYGEREQCEFALSFNTSLNLRTNNLHYDSSSSSNTYAFSMLEYDFSGIDSVYAFKKIVYLVPSDGAGGDNFQAGYDKGYQDGLMNTDVYQYAEEYYNNGYNAGYAEGVHQGIQESGNNILGNMLITIFDVPLMYLSGLLNFNLLGINLLGLLGAIISLGLIIFLIKKLL